MTKGTTVVVYKPDSQSTDEYMVHVDPVQFDKWKNGDVVDCEYFQISFSGYALNQLLAYEIFHTGQGAQGLQMRPSNQQLDSIFGTSKDVDVVEFILNNGKPQHGDNFGKNSKGTANMNVARGSTVIDSRGKGGLTGI